MSACFAKSARSDHANRRFVRRFDLRNDPVAPEIRAGAGHHLFGVSEIPHLRRDRVGKFEPRRDQPRARLFHNPLPHRKPRKIPMTNLTALTAANARRWAAAKPTRNFQSVALRLVSDQPQRRAERQGALHGRVEAHRRAVVRHRRDPRARGSQSWNGSLAQGDPWNRTSVHVPKGRGPFKSWEDAAVDALTNCAPFAARWRDWSIGGILTLLEQYNGLGYAARGVPSPYIWAGTDQYHSGKYVRDGVYDPNVVDRQLGCAGLLMAMMRWIPRSSSARRTPTTTSPQWCTRPARSWSPRIPRPARRRRRSPIRARLDRGVDRVLVQARRIEEKTNAVARRTRLDRHRRSRRLAAQR
jgi:hypothetical protein